MPLTPEERTRVEDTIMDLHFTSQKFIDTQKEIHRKLLVVNVQEALEILQDVHKNMQDDPKKYDYKMHMLLPMQLYELMIVREEKK